MDTVLLILHRKTSMMMIACYSIPDSLLSLRTTTIFRDEKKRRLLRVLSVFLSVCAGYVSI